MNERKKEGSEKDSVFLTSENPADSVSIEIGRQYKNWLSDFVAEQKVPSMTERQVIERLLHHFRAIPDEEQQNILRAPSRPFNRIGEIIEVLPATASVFRSTPHP